MRHIILLHLTFYFLGNLDCFRMKREIFPIKYDLTVTPYFESESDTRFEGRLVFTFKPLRHNTVSIVALHADGLDINSFMMLQDNNNVTEQLEAVSWSKEQLLYFDTGQQLSVDNTYELRINYTGSIRDDGWGLYKGTYEHEGKKRFYAVTQLRPVFARRLLPCLDEPSYKARFVFRVWRLPLYTALSNMPLVNTSPKNLASGRVMDTFADTPLMSTFLLALVVFDFASLTSADKKFSSWTVPSKIHLAKYGQKMLPAIVEAMEGVAGSKFPMSKLDHIALPQLNVVAMENWGMDTFREVNMLCEEGTYHPRVRQDVPRFTGHEVAHHWLGNLVTLEWWDWLWLSEMYAMYYEFYLLSQVKPSWRLVDQMVVDVYIPGMLEDSFNTSKPLTTHVSTNQEILAKFSGTTYTKGPALVRMIDNFMSHPRAERALQALLREKKYGTVNPTELWRIYDSQAEGLPAPMSVIMSSWTDQAGYPLVTVSINQSSGTVTLQQERFLIEGTAKESSLWWIPLSCASGLKPNFTDTHTRLWLSPNKPVTVVNLGRPIDSWIIFNLQHIGFYRVNYDTENWNRLIKTLHAEPTRIHELNRAQLLDDSFSLARAGHLPYTVPLELSSYLVREGCYFPWAAFLPTFNFLLNTLNGHPAYKPLMQYVKLLVAPAYDSVGFSLRSSDSHLRQMHRVQVATLACSLGLPACVQAAQRQEKLISQGKLTEIPPGLESVQLCTILEAGMSAEDVFHHLSLWTVDDQVRAMPCAADKEFLRRYLTKSSEEDSAAEWRTKFAAAITRPANIDVVFSLLLDRYPILLSRFGTANITDYFTMVGSRLSTINQRNKLEDILIEVMEDELRSALKAISASLTSRLNWLQRYLPVIQSWLHEYNTNRPYNDQHSVDPDFYCQ